MFSFIYLFVYTNVYFFYINILGKFIYSYMMMFISYILIFDFFIFFLHLHLYMYNDINYIFIQNSEKNAPIK